ncbi:hypothetical protein ALO43_200491 [Pseudomonas tremae]|uniref:Cobyric acid synthase n=1 Tax=Pseudomonas tremae TaxID=200454 RepID=A0AA40P0T3_9PSED|nr:hypothetical protein ALO43_200491 [Pseudomonas tremae]RMS25680.1 hypothetical protein ALP71_200044 [Pseudomonas coronafaciens pv. garcae]
MHFKSGITVDQSHSPIGFPLQFTVTVQYRNGDVLANRFVCIVFLRCDAVFFARAIDQ